MGEIDRDRGVGGIWPMVHGGGENSLNSKIDEESVKGGVC